MKKLLLALTLLLIPASAWAQCNGIFPDNTVCGNITGANNLPRPTPPSAFQGSAGGSNGQIQYNNNGALAGATGGDVVMSGTNTVIQNKTGTGANIATSTGALTANDCVKLDANGNFVDAGNVCSTTSTPSTFGAKCDVVTVTGATSITSGAASLTVTGANFQPSDVGKVISIPGAGVTSGGVAQTLITTISARTSTTQVTLAKNANTTLSAVSTAITYGTDDTTALQSFFTSTTVSYLDVTNISGCMYTTTLTSTLPKMIIGNRAKSTLWFRQLTGTTPIITINLSTGSDGSVFRDFSINADSGDTITASSNLGIIDVTSLNDQFLNLDINGNRSTQAFPSWNGINGGQTGTVISGCAIHDLGRIGIRSIVLGQHVLVSNNRVFRTGKAANSTGGIVFFLNGLTGDMSDLRILNNSINLSDLLIADQNVGIYVIGGSPTSTTNMYNNVVIANNTIIGTANTTSTTTGGIFLFQANNSAISNNTIKWFGEDIGSSTNFNVTIEGNALYGGGTYNLETNTDQGISITGNTLKSDGYSTVASMTSENMLNGSVTGNVFDVNGSGTGINGAVFIGVSNGNGTATENVTITGNSVFLSNNTAASGIKVQCNSNATVCADYIIANNVVNSLGTPATGSNGIYVSKSGSPTTAGFQLGPNMTRQDVGTRIDSGVSNLCYIAGYNGSTTALVNNGTGSTCN